jgi:hypothetical protein
LALLASFLQDQYGKIMEKLWKHWLRWPKIKINI